MYKNMLTEGMRCIKIQKKTKREVEKEVHTEKQRYSYRGIEQRDTTDKKGNVGWQQVGRKVDKPADWLSKEWHKNKQKNKTIK